MAKGKGELLLTTGARAGLFPPSGVTLQGLVDHL